MSKSNAFNTIDAPLNASLNPPPTIVVPISRIANNPLKVLVSLSAVSSLTLSFSVKELTALRRLYNRCDFFSIMSSSDIPL